MAGDLTKNVGPLLTSWVSGNASALPQEWQAKVGFYQEDQEMPLGYVPNGATASGIVLEQRLIQTRTDERKRTSLVLNPAPGGGLPPPGGGPPGSWTRVEEVRLPNGAIGTRTYALVPEGSHLSLTNDMIQAEQKNTGLGVLDQVVMTTPLAEPTIISTKVEADGSLTYVSKTRKLISDIIPNEQESVDLGGLWTKVSREGETGLVATEVVEQRPVYPVGTGRSVLSVVLDQDANLVTVARTMRKTGDITPAAQVVSGTVFKVEKKEVSDLVSEEIYSTYPWLDKAAYSVAREIGLPSEYRSLLITSDVSHIVAGTAVMPTLDTGEIEHSEQQVDRLFKRVTIKGSTTATLPVTQYGEELTQQFGGLLLYVEKTIDNWGPSQVPPASLNLSTDDITSWGVVSAKTTPYGTYGIRERKTTQTGYGAMVGGEVDPLLNVVMPYTKQVGQAGTNAAAGPGHSWEVEPIDLARSWVTHRYWPDALNTFYLYFPSTTNVDFPPELISLTAVPALLSGASGTSTNSGSYTLYGGGNGNINPSAQSHGSAAAMMDVTPEIKHTWAQNIPSHHLLFFIAGPTITYQTVLNKVKTFGGYAGTQAWPRFKPKALTFSCIGQKMGGQAKAGMTLADSAVVDYLGRLISRGSSVMRETGTSIDTEVTVKTVQIPPTIHNALTIANYYKSQGFSSNATIGVGGSSLTAYANGTATASISPPNCVRTPGASTIPTVGVFLYKMRVEPYKFGYFKCDCEMVNANDWA